MVGGCVALSHVSIQNMLLRRALPAPILIATPLPQSLTFCTRGRQRARRRNQLSTVRYRDNARTSVPSVSSCSTFFDCRAITR